MATNTIPFTTFKSSGQTLMTHRISMSLVLIAALLCASPASAQTKASAKRADAAKPTFANVPYGPAERNVLDFWQAPSDMPTPLIVYIHGGGFVAGDKSSIAPGMVQAATRGGISIAAINYRFVNGKEVIFPAPQLDGARAVQFLRSKASDWNIDPKRVACYGGSAGAGISMWIGFHDDLADLRGSDPVLRQSTRITAIGTMGGQAMYDPIKIKELVGGRAWEHPSIFKVYGVTSAEEALHPTPEKQKLYDESSAITHLTKDDPPLFMVYSEPDAPLPADARLGQGIHHPKFGKLLKKEMDQLGIENVYVHTEETPRRNVSLEMLNFFRKHFGMPVQER
ncbi:MAG: alpha/beta hydrolase [Planctomycetes bacterium]|nr:alpha/beta hydrolase [Planctomycetota bacterium]